MPQLGRLTSRSLAGIGAPPTGVPTRSITWQTYSVNATTGVQTVGGPAATNGTVAFFPTLCTAAGGINKVIKFNGSAVVEQSLPAPTLGAYPRYVSYGGSPGRFVLLGSPYPGGSFTEATSAWISTDGGNTFSVTNLASPLNGGGGLYSLAHLNNTFYAFSASSSVSPNTIYWQSSTTGTTWSALQSGGASSVSSALANFAVGESRILLRGGSTGSPLFYSRLTATSSPAVLNSVSSPSNLGSASSQRVGWIRGFGFVLIPGNVSNPLYSLSQASFDSGSDFSIWNIGGSTPGFSEIGVADNGLDAPVVVLREWGFGTSFGRISFDGGTNFSNLTLPFAGSSIYPDRLTGGGNKMFLSYSSFTTPATHNIAVGSIA